MAASVRAAAVSRESARASPTRVRSRLRFRRGGALAATLLALLLGLLAWSGWSRDAATVLVGVEVEHDGGSFVVLDAWTTGDPMVAMHPDDVDHFASSGMQMSGMISDAVPEGSKRVAVEVVLRAGAGPMRFPSDEVRLEVDQTRYPPYDALLGDGVLAPGTQLNGAVIFEVPDDSGAALFRLAADTRPVAVDVGGGPGIGPRHGDH